MNSSTKNNSNKKDDSSSDSSDEQVNGNHCVQMIHELQLYKGYSLSRIAKRCGVSPSTIRNIASGNVKMPRLPLMRKILILHCKIFNPVDFNKVDKDKK